MESKNSFIVAGRKWDGREIVKLIMNGEAGWPFQGQVRTSVERNHEGVPVVGQWVKNPWSSRCGAAQTNPTRNPEVSGSIPGLIQWVKDTALP